MERAIGSSAVGAEHTNNPPRSNGVPGVHLEAWGWMSRVCTRVSGTKDTDRILPQTTCANAIAGGDAVGRNAVPSAEVVGSVVCVNS